MRRERFVAGHGRGTTKRFSRAIAAQHGRHGRVFTVALVERLSAKRIAQTIFRAPVAAMAAHGPTVPRTALWPANAEPDRGPCVIGWNCASAIPRPQRCCRAWKMTFCLGCGRGQGRAASRLAHLVDQHLGMRGAGSRGLSRKYAAAMRSRAWRKTDSFWRGHRSRRVSRRHQARGRALAHQWPAGAGCDRPGRGSQFSTSPPTVALTVFGGMACTIERHCLEDEHERKTGQRRGRFDGVEIRPRNHEAGRAGLPQARLSVDVRVLSAHRHA